MTTTTLQHVDIERSRFGNLVLAALGAAIPATLGNFFGRAKVDGANQAAVDAQHVREIARGYAKSDPGFAADLYAAAARHEGLSDR